MKKNTPKTKKRFILVLSLCLIILAAIFLALYITKFRYAHIDSFEKCIGDQPYLTIASAECTTPDGRTFIRGED